MKSRLLVALLALTAACSSGSPANPHATATSTATSHGPRSSALAGVILGYCDQGVGDRPALTQTQLGTLFGDQTGPGAAGTDKWTQLVGVDGRFVSDYLDDTSMSGLRYQNHIIDCWKSYLDQHPGSNVIYGLPMLSDEQFPNLNADLETRAANALAGYKEGTSADPSVNFDADFKALAQTLISSGQSKAYLRLGWEFNCDCSQWPADVDPAMWVRYWRHIVTVMRSVPGAQFSFIWNVNHGYNGNDFVDGRYDPDNGGEFNAEVAFPDDPTIDPSSYVAADAPYVNVVSTDLYDVNYAGDGKGAVGYPFPRNASPSLIEQGQKLALKSLIYGDQGGSVGHAQRHTAEWWRDFANEHGKPFGISEWGLARNPDQPASGPYPGPTLDCTGSPLPFPGNCNGGGDDPTFIDGFVSWLQTTYTTSKGSTPIAFAEYFDGNSEDPTNPGAGTDNRIDSAWSPKALARLKVDLQAAADAGH